jgi:hypothetical protein
MAEVMEVGALSASDIQVSSEAERKTRDVQIGIIVRRLFNVDTVEQVFGTQFTVIMMWDCPEGEEPDEDDDGDWVPKWTPKYMVRKVMEEIRKNEQFSCVVVDGRRVVKMEAEWVVNLQERLELHAFPVDCQELSIEIASVMPTSSYRFLPLVSSGSKSSGGGKSQLVRLLTSGCEMNDFELLTSRPFTFDLFMAKMLLKTVSQLTVKIQVQRKSSYYMINVALVMFLICSFSFCAWSCHPADMGSRHGVDFNLILTAVAFKLVLTSMLPPVSYVTLLDMYVMSCFGFLACVTVSHTLLPLQYYDLSDNSPLKDPGMPHENEGILVEADEVSFWIAGSAWVAFNFFSLLYFLYRRHKEHKHMVSNAEKEQRAFNPKHMAVVDMTCGKVVSSEDFLEMTEEAAADVSDVSCAPFMEEANL